MNATEGDIEAQRPKIKRVERVVADSAGHRIVMAEPDNWRAIARYLHADAMMKQRLKMYG
jgi:hypothetical protein